MRWLPYLILLGLLPFAHFAWKVAVQFRALRERASEQKGFHLRRASLSIAEWRRWNEEFWTWKTTRFPLLLVVFEGIIMAYLLKLSSKLPFLWAWLGVLQILPLATVYFLHLWLIFRYGRFNLQRFDSGQQTSRALIAFLFYFSAWLPVVGSWLYVFLFLLGGR